MATRHPANLVGNWADEMRAVVLNFRKFMHEAVRLDTPGGVPPERLPVYNRRKHQLMASMLFYTTQIISSGMRVAMESSEVTTPFRDVLRSVRQLQEEIIQQGTDFETIYDRIYEADYRPNPLVLYLKMVLDDVTPEPDLARVQQLLRDLHFEHIPDVHKNYAPGMPACILALYSPGHRLIVTATKDRYKALGLPHASKSCWRARLQRLRGLCTNDKQNTIEDLEKLSRDFIVASGVTDQNTSVDLNRQEMKTFLADQAGLPFRVELTVPANSIVATWKPDGSYLASCLLDYYRFVINRPDENVGPSNLAFDSDCCAEWFAFIELALSDEQIRTAVPLPTSLSRPRPTTTGGRGASDVFPRRIESKSSGRGRGKGKGKGSGRGSGADSWRSAV